VHILVFALIFGILYFVVTLIVDVLPTPMKPLGRAVLLGLLCLIFVLLLLGELGVMGPMSWSYNHGRL
jgi:hypothetical protein